VLVVELVEDFGPPHFVVLALNKLLQLILFWKLAHGLSFDRIATMLIQVVPVLGHVTRSQEDLLVTRVIAILQVHVVSFLQVLANLGLLSPLECPRLCALFPSRVSVPDEAIILGRHLLHGRLIGGCGLVLGR